MPSPATHTARFKMPSGLSDMDVELPELTTELPGGSTGYYQRRQDDCWRAAVATVLQMDYDQVPDWEGEPGTHAQELQSWMAMAEWAHSLGYRVRFHDGFPGDDADRGCYVGVGPGDRGDRYRHVVAVMNGHVFEPGSGFKFPAWMRLEPLRQVEFSISFEEEKC